MYAAVRRIVCVALVSVSSSGGAASPIGRRDDPGSHWAGTFSFSHALALYVVNPSNHPVHVRLVAFAATAPPREGNRVLIRAFDPGERYVFWHYRDARSGAEIKMEQEALPSGPSAVALPAPAIPNGAETMLDVTLELRGEGIHQIRAHASCASRLHVVLSEPRRIGMSAQNGRFEPWRGDGPSRLFAYVPPRTRLVGINGGPLRVLDEAGVELFRSTRPGPLRGADRSLRDDPNEDDPDGGIRPAPERGGRPRGGRRPARDDGPAGVDIGAAGGGDLDYQRRIAPYQRFAVPRTDVVWSFEFDAPGWSFEAFGMPLILCEDAETARTIRASVVFTDDGRVLSHQWQKTIYAMLPELLRPERVGRADGLIARLSRQADAWLAEPRRNLLLLPLMRDVERALREQNVDPESPWAGCFEGWRELTRTTPDGSWDGFLKLPGMTAGHSFASSETHGGRDTPNFASLGHAATLDAACNPYAGRKELLYRAAAGGLRDLLAVQESEVFPDFAPAAQDAGQFARAYSTKTLPLYAATAPHLPADIRDVWTDAVRRLVDRGVCASLSAARNQSARWLVTFGCFAKGSGRPDYAAVARAFMRVFAGNARRAGYHEEDHGPCAGYTGLTHDHLCAYHALTGDETALESLARSYRLFNHTVAVEPDGSLTAGFSFNHRISQSTLNEMRGGARIYAASLAPDVAARTPAPSPRQVREDEDHARLVLGRVLARNDLSRIRTNARVEPFLRFDRPALHAVLPSREPGDFLREFGGEFVSVKRGDYFATIYVGRPAMAHLIASRIREAEPADGRAMRHPLAGCPFNGGGLVIFSTTAFGASVLGSSRSPLTHHGLVATIRGRDGAEYRWEAYDSVRHRLDSDRRTLTVAGVLKDSPVSYTRTYFFEDDGVRVDLTLAAARAVSFERLIENLPIAAGSAKPHGATIRIVNDGRAADVAGRDGQVTRIVFAGPRYLRAVNEGIPSGKRGLEIKRVEVSLPARFETGQQASLTYKILAR